MKKTKNNDGLKNYAKYSGAAFQMFVIIALSVWGGKKIDEILEVERPTFLVILSLFGVITSIYLVIKDLIKKP